MNEVKIIRTKSRIHFAHSEFEDTEGIINEMYKYGWKYKGFIPAVIKGYGAITEIDLVFEKEKEE